MTKKKNHNSKNNKFFISKSWLVLLTVIILGCLAWWYAWEKLQIVPILEDDKEVQMVRQRLKTENVKDEIIVIVKDLEAHGKYGNWPIENVTLSADRGNPFSPTP